MRTKERCPGCGYKWSKHSMTTIAGKRLCKKCHIQRELEDDRKSDKTI